MGIEISIKVGDWVVDVDGLTRRISSDNMIDLPFEKIAKKLTGKAIPEFKYDERICLSQGLNYKGFFDAAKVHCPLAFKEFSAFMDSYKSMNRWGKYFKDGIKFHDLPFHLQVGVMIKFYVHYNVYFHTWNDDFSAPAILSSIAWSFTSVEVELRNKSLNKNKQDHAG